MVFAVKVEFCSSDLDLSSSVPSSELRTHLKLHVKTPESILGFLIDHHDRPNFDLIDLPLEEL